MSTEIRYTYPLAPIEVQSNAGRSGISRPVIEFEVQTNGSVEIYAESRDRHDSDVYLTISAEDWEAVVAHVERDQKYAEGIRNAKAAG